MESYCPVLVGCLIDCSVDVLTEWSDILKHYLNPIFYSIATATKRGSDVIRIGLVTYGDCESPSPICARRFFASAPLILKEDMMGDPFGLGLGTVASNNQGMSVLEGYVALLEMFDAAEITRPRPNAQSQIEEKPYEPIFYLIHIASSGPDKMVTPAFNNNPAFDNVTWETLPAEISKRKMRHNLILLRSVSELIELSKTLNGPTASFGILPRKPMHKLLLAGLPHVENKTVPLKRPLSDQEGASAAKHPHPPSQDQSGSSVIQASPVKSPTVVPPSQPQRVPNVNQLKALMMHNDIEIRKKVKELQELVASNAPKERIETLQRAITAQNQGRSKIMLLLSQLIGQQVPRGTAGPGSAIHSVAGPSNQLVPGQGAIVPKADVFTQPVGASNPIGSVVPVKGDVPVRTSSGAGIDVQLTKMIAERTRPPVLAAAPQTQGQPQPTTTAPPSSEPQPTQPAGQGAKNSSEELIQIMEMPTQISNYPRRWEGLLSWPTALPTGERRELTLQVAFFSDPNLNTNWPKKLALQAGKKAVDPAFLQACIKEFKPSMGLIIPWPSVGNAEMSVRNYRLYVGMREVFFQRSTVGIALMDIPNGPKGAGMVFLPVKSPQRALITMVFHQTPVPVNIITLLDLPVAPNPPMQSNATGSTNTMPLQMTPEAQAYLQQQRNNALNAYTQQQVLAQQAQRQAMLPTAGAPMSAGAAYNINQFFQNMQAQAQQQGGLGYAGQGPQMQQVQHRQPSGGYTPAQIAQMMQFGMNRPPDGGQGV